jgi:uncharacterized protein
LSKRFSATIVFAMTVVRPQTDSTGGRPVVPTRSRMRPLGLHEVRITGGFWADRQQVNGESTLDHARGWMERLGWIGNFRAGQGSPERRGRAFSDSEVYKLLEATAWEAGRTGDPARDSQVVDLTGLIASAQSPDGYINTAFGRPGQRPRYSDLSFGHELYCVGHLLQAAVAQARVGGADGLMDVALRAADHVCDVFGPGVTNGICGHPEIEPALVELARVSGEQRYLDQAALFIRRRGRRTLPLDRNGWRYYSDDIPVESATVLRGHAVRALYLACGAVDVAVETEDDELLEAVIGQFDRTLARRTYLTGGMGSYHTDESFGDDFVLPADRAYAETCAGVAAVMLAWRLLLATGDHRYADVIERVLYNIVATAVSDDGRAFFYANTLHQRTLPEAVGTDRERLGVSGGQRSPWFEVACCIPNIARLLASLGTYIATADADGVQIHQYADADVTTRLGDGRRVGLVVRTPYPTQGTVTVRITETDGGAWGVTLRVPEWADGAELVGPDGRRPVAPGPLHIRYPFAVGDELRLELPMSPRWTFPDPRIDAVRGCVAVERGPLVLCVESTSPDDLDLDALSIDPTAPLRDTPSDEAGAIGRGQHHRHSEPAWPYGVGGQRREDTESVPVRLVPYHRWGRRGPSTMRVWLPILKG